MTRVQELIKEEKFKKIIPACNEEIGLNGKFSPFAKLTRATFSILTKMQDEAQKDLTEVIEDEEAGKAIRVNALIKRASLYIQQCKDPLYFRDGRQCQFIPRPILLPRGRQPEGSK